MTKIIFLLALSKVHKLDEKEQLLFSTFHNSPMSFACHDSQARILTGSRSLPVGIS